MPAKQDCKFQSQITNHNFADLNYKSQITSPNFACLKLQITKKEGVNEQLNTNGNEGIKLKEAIEEAKDAEDAEEADEADVNK